MANKLKDNPFSNPGQEDYDRKFNEITGSADNKAFEDQVDAEHDNGFKYTGDKDRDALGEGESSGFDGRVGASDEQSRLEGQTGLTGNGSQDIPFNKSKTKPSFAKRIAAKVTKRTVIGVSGMAVAGGLIFGMFSAILPAKLLSYVENIQDRFTSIGEEAVEKRTKVLMSRYFRKYVFTSGCKTTTNKDCLAKDIVGNSMASKMFRGWRDAKIENEMATKYGMEFSYDRSGGVRLKMPNEDWVDVSSVANIGGGAGNDDMFDAIADKHYNGRKEVRMAFRDAISKETKFRQVWLRHKYGKLLERKYKLIRCVFVCESRDDLADWKDHKKLAFKTRLVERVVEPRSEIIAIIIECLLTDGGARCNRLSEVDKNGALNSEFEGKMERKLESKLARKLGVKTVGELADKIEDIRNSGSMTNWLLKLAVTRGWLKAGTSAALGKAIPLIGWIDLAVKIYKAEREAPKFLRLAKYTSYAASSGGLYMMYRTQADECRSGGCEAEMLGSVVDSLGDSSSDQGSGISPMYNEIMGTKSMTTSSLFGGTAYAESESPKMLCDDGKPVKDDKLICPEHDFRFGGAIEDILNIWESGVAVADSPYNVFAMQLKLIVELWDRVVTPILDKLNSIIGFIIGPATEALLRASGLQELMASVIGAFQRFFLERVIGNPIKPDSSGAVNFTMAVGSAASASAENNNNGMGGIPLTSGQARTINIEHEEKRLYAQSKKSFASRFFDLEDTESLASRVALSAPNKPTGLAKPLLALFNNPLAPAMQLAGAATTEPVSAADYSDATYTSASAFGIKTIGVPLDHPAITADPEKYTPEYCSEFNRHWFKGEGKFDGINFNGTFKEDKDTAYRYHTIVNPCLLEEQTTGAAGGLFTDEVLRPDERELSNTGGSSDGPGDPTDPTDPVDPKEDTSKIPCAPGTEDGGEHIDYGPGRTNPVRIRICGIPGAIPASRGVNSSIAKQVLDMITAMRAAGLNPGGNAFRSYEAQEALYAQNCRNGKCSPPTAKPGNSMHEVGLAIDFSNMCFPRGRTCPGNDRWEWLVANAAKYGLKQLESEAWHWSVNGN